MLKTRSIKTLPLDGGALAFHFINTVYAWRGENLHEYFGSYEEVLQWCKKVKVLPVKLLKGLEIHAREHPAETVNSLDKIKEIRLLLYRFFSGFINKSIETSLLASYNAILQDALSHYKWRKTTGGLNYIPAENPTDLLLPVYVVLKQSHDLIVSEKIERIKECPRCGWIFLDHTKNKKRKWCNPASCGSVEKTHKYYQKIKKERQAAVDSE